MLLDTRSFFFKRKIESREFRRNKLQRMIGRKRNHSKPDGAGALEAPGREPVGQRGVLHGATPIIKDMEESRERRRERKRFTTDTNSRRQVVERRPYGSPVRLRPSAGVGVAPLASCASFVVVRPSALHAPKGKKRFVPSAAPP